MEEDILNLVFAYQKAPDLDGRLGHVERIIGVVGPPLKAFLLKRCPEHFDEVFSATLEGVVRSLRRFRGKDKDSLWSLCYRIALNKISDRLRRKMAENRFILADAEDIWRVLEAIQAKEGMSAGDRLDYEYLIGLLKASKPDCFDFLYKRYALQWDYRTIAADYGLLVPTARIRTNRCLEHAQGLANKHL